MDASRDFALFASSDMLFFQRDYPLIKLFPFGNDILLYDAKPHFAFIISRAELEILKDFLTGKPDDEVIHSHSARSDGRFVSALLTKFAELKDSGMFIKGPATAISPLDTQIIAEQIRYYDECILLRKFCLEVTGDCNYRCTYCKRTIGNGYKKHSPDYLSEENARRGINYYFKKYIEFFTKLPEAKKELLLEILPPGLSWYGGEPFLNFTLIENSATYFKSLPWAEYSISENHLRFSSNTNLSIMNDEILTFLTENRVYLYASLDGPHEEHDKCRVFKNGAGTFRIAYDNLLKLRAFSETYFKKYVTILGVYTDKHDYNKCVEFTSNVGASGCDHSPAEYVGAFVANPETAVADFANSMEKRLAAFKEKASAASGDGEGKMGRFANLFPYANLNVDHPAGSNSLNISVACPMGFDNLMLSAKGEYVICHKVDDSMPIGDCEAGLNFDKLVELNYRYNLSINNEECKKCWIVNFCRVCAAPRMAGGRFINPTEKECDYFRLHTAYDFSCFIHLSLEHPDLLEKIFEYKNDKKSFVGIIDINEF